MSPSAKILCLERLRRLQYVLRRTPSQCMTIRDLVRSHGIKAWEIEQAASGGWIEITVPKSPRGRPSRIACLVPQEETSGFKLPPERRALPRPLNPRHQAFIQRYWCKGGLSPSSHCLGPGFSSAGSATHAYHRVYRFAEGCDKSKPRRKPPKFSSIKSAAARLARQPWIKAASLYSSRIPPRQPVSDSSSPAPAPASAQSAPALSYPEDMRSAGEKWLRLLRFLDQEFPYGWPADVIQALRNAHTIVQAAEAIAQTESLLILDPAWRAPNNRGIENYEKWLRLCHGLRKVYGQHWPPEITQALKRAPTYKDAVAALDQIVAKMRAPHQAALAPSQQAHPQTESTDQSSPIIQPTQTSVIAEADSEVEPNSENKVEIKDTTPSDANSNPEVPAQNALSSSITSSQKPRIIRQSVSLRSMPAIQFRAQRTKTIRSVRHSPMLPMARFFLRNSLNQTTSEPQSKAG